MKWRKEIGIGLCWKSRSLPRVDESAGTNVVDGAFEKPITKPSRHVASDEWSSTCVGMRELPLSIEGAHSTSNKMVKVNPFDA